MSTNIQTLSKKDKEVAIATLKKAAEGIKGDDPIVTFIDELLTESEQVTIGRRILIAQMLLSGYSRAEIRYHLKVSPNTFTRARQWLERQFPNYGDALKAAREKDGNQRTKSGRKRGVYIDPVSFAVLKRKYPIHFLLFNIVEEITKR